MAITTDYAPSVLLFTVNYDDADYGGVAFDGTNVMFLNTSDDTVYVHDGLTSNVLTSFPVIATAPPNNFQTMWVQGNELHLNTNDQVHVYDLTTQALLASYDTTIDDVVSAAFFTGDGLVVYRVLFVGAGGDELRWRAGATYLSGGEYDFGSAVDQGSAYRDYSVVFDGTNVVSLTTTNTFNEKTVTLRIHDGMTSTVVDSAVIYEHEDPESVGFVAAGGLLYSEGTLISVIRVDDVVSVYRHQEPPFWTELDNATEVVE